MHVQRSFSNKTTNTIDDIMQSPAIRPIKTTFLITVDRHRNAKLLVQLFASLISTPSTERK